MTEFETDCSKCPAFIFMEVMTIADSMTRESEDRNDLKSKEDIVKERKLHYIATVSENAVSKLRVDGKLCRQCPWYDK